MQARGQRPETGNDGHEPAGRRGTRAGEERSEPVLYAVVAAGEAAGETERPEELLRPCDRYRCHEAGESAARAADEASRSAAALAEEDPRFGRVRYEVAEIRLAEMPGLCYDEVLKQDGSIAAMGPYGSGRTLRDAGDPGRPKVHPHAAVAGDAVLEWGVEVGAGTVVESGARLKSGALVGNDCRIGTGSQIGAHTTTGNRVNVGNRAEIGPESVLCDDVRIADEERVDGRVVIEAGCRIEQGAELKAGVRTGRETLVGPHAEIGKGTATGARTTVGGGAELGAMVRTGPGAAITAAEDTRSNGNGRPAGPAPTVEDGAWIGAGAEVRGRVRLGPGSRTGDGARVSGTAERPSDLGAGATTGHRSIVEESTVAERGHIDSDAEVRRSAIGAEGAVLAGARLAGCELEQGAVAAWDTQAEGIRLPADARLTGPEVTDANGAEGKPREQPITRAELPADFGNGHPEWEEDRLIAAGKSAGRRPEEPGVDPGAFVAAGAKVSPTAAVLAGAVIEAGAVVEEYAVVGRNTRVGKGASLGPGARAGEGAEIGPHARIGTSAEIGGEARIGPGAAIGPMTQVRRGAEIGENCRIDEGVLIGTGTVVERECEVGRGTMTGPGCVIGAGTRVEERTTIGGGSAIGHRCRLGTAPETGGTSAGPAHIAKNSNVGREAGIERGTRMLEPRSIEAGQCWTAQREEEARRRQRRETAPPGEREPGAHDRPEGGVVRRGSESPRTGATPAPDPGPDREAAGAVEAEPPAELPDRGGRQGQRNAEAAARQAPGR